MKEEKYLEMMSAMKKKLAFYNAEESVNRKGLFYDGNTISNAEKKSMESGLPFLEVSSSLMIPLELISILKVKLKKYKGLKLYLHHLIRKYTLHIANGLIPQYSGVTTKYQEENQDLQKVGIRPMSSDWAELQLLRCSHGISMSAIFVYLLKADSVDFANALSEYLVKAGIPTVPNLNLFGGLQLESGNYFFTRVFRFEQHTKPT